MSDTSLHKTPELTKIRRGHWRSRWYSERDCSFSDGRQRAGAWLGVRRWPSAEVAEEKAADWLRTYRDYARAHGMRHLGVTFFPEE